MTDPILAPLWQRLAELPAPRLVVADENCRDAPWHRLPADTRVLSNRCDVAAQAEAAGLDSRFSDFDLSDWTSPPATVAYRVSKEKPVVHHIINRSWQQLPTGGRLLLAGEKSDGIKTYADKAAALFDDDTRARKTGRHYVCELERGHDRDRPLLDDQDYTRIREVAAQEGVRLFGKPGLFGWDRIDAGSALLVDNLPALLGERHYPRLLDLGCGSGYLAAMAARWCDVAVATDNNAAALAVARQTFAANAVAGDVVAADCGAGLEPGFDLILCNPPFHQGFDASRDLTERFLCAAARLLASGGQALFVVNGFIPLETLATRHFRDVRIAVHERSFKVVQLGRPSRP